MCGTPIAADKNPLERRSEFPPENIKLVLLRQACAENDPDLARRLFNEATTIYRQDPSVHWLGLHLMGKPDEAHQLLVDAELDMHALASFLNYPFFDHTWFPELAGILEQQGIDRPFIKGPPYACKSDQS